MFTVVPFTKPEVIETAFSLRNLLRDYIDCIILGTAIALGETLVTEDKDIHSIAGLVEKEYGVKIYSYKSLLEEYRRKV